jgi:hypothetical protein
MVSILTSQLHLFQEIIDADTEHLLQPQQKNPSTISSKHTNQRRTPSNSSQQHKTFP